VYQGYGNTIDVTDASKAKDAILGTGVYAATISAGQTNTCAILSNNKLLCWGDNYHGKPISMTQ
jgi:Regulator of chromosome condensation (RCC1) repeat